MQEIQQRVLKHIFSLEQFSDVFLGMNISMDQITEPESRPIHLQNPHERCDDEVYSLRKRAFKKISLLLQTNLMIHKDIARDITALLETRFQQTDASFGQQYKELILHFLKLLSVRCCSPSTVCSLLLSLQPILFVPL